MWLNDFIFDVGNRIGVEKINGPLVVRTLNRKYRAINSEHKALIKELEMDFSTLTTFVPRWPYPEDCISILRVEPQTLFFLPRDQIVLEGEDGAGSMAQEGAFTELAGELVFNGVDAASVVTIWYLSTGLEFALKKTTALAVTEINEPEYTQTWMKDGLLYAVALELSSNYPNRKEDQLTFAKFERKLRQNPYRLNMITSEPMGGVMQPVRRDGYGEY